MKKTKSKKSFLKRFQKGRAGAGNIFIITILVLLFTVAATAVGGLPSMLSPTNGTTVKIKPPVQNTQHNNLQLETFGYVTLVPTPTKAPPATTALCQNGGVNNEPEILVGYSPGPGQTVTSNGLIKVWVNDEGAPMVAPGEKVDPTTGAITAAGDRNALAPDNYRWEPALYVSPQTAESGGSPHYPNFIKGDYNNAPPDRGQGIAGPSTDPIPAGSTHDLPYMAEYIWNVSGLGLAPGSYVGEFVIHDGDRDRGVGCVNFTVQ